MIPAGSGAWGFEEVVLPNDDLDAAVRVGKIQHRYAISQGWGNTLAVGGESEHIDGVYGEIAIARIYGAAWSEERATDPAYMQAPDVGGTEVRSTRWPDGYLPFRPRRHDRRERAFSLVILGEARGLCRAVGWIYGFDAAVPRYHRPADAKGPAFYAVPQEALTDPAWLPIIREGEA